MKKWHFVNKPIFMIFFSLIFGYLKRNSISIVKLNKKKNLKKKIRDILMQVLFFFSVYLCDLQSSFCVLMPDLTFVKIIFQFNLFFSSLISSLFSKFLCSFVRFQNFFLFLTDIISQSLSLNFLHYYHYYCLRNFCTNFNYCRVWRRIFLTIVK